MKKIDLNLLRVFIVVYKERNLKRSSHLIGLSAPSLSIKLAKLKDLLGNELFFKSASGFEPTEAAHKLFIKVEPLVSQLDDTLANINGFNPEEIDQAIVMDIGQHFAPWLQFGLFEFISQHCPHSYLIADYFTNNTVDRLRRSEVDVGIQVDQADVPKDIICIPVGYIEGGFVVRKDHPIKSAEASIEDICQYGFAMYEQNITSVGSNGHFINELDQRNISYQIKFRSPSALSVHKTISATDLVFPTSIKHYENSDDLRVVRIKAGQVNTKFPVLAYVYQENRYSERCKWLIEEVKRILSGNTIPTL